MQNCLNICQLANQRASIFISLITNNSTALTLSTLENELELTRVDPFRNNFPFVSGLRLVRLRSYLIEKYNGNLLSRVSWTAWVVMNKHSQKVTEEVAQHNGLGFLSIKISSNLERPRPWCQVPAEDASDPFHRVLLLREKFKPRSLSVTRDYCCWSLLLMFSFSFHANGQRILNDSFLNN